MIKFRRKGSRIVLQRDLLCTGHARDIHVFSVLARELYCCEVKSSIAHQTLHRLPQQASILFSENNSSFIVGIYPNNIRNHDPQHSSSSSCLTTLSPN